MSTDKQMETEQRAERKVLTTADIEARTAGMHSCGWDGPGPKMQSKNPPCDCMCGASYAEDGIPILGRGGRAGMRCKHVDSRGKLLPHTADGFCPDIVPQTETMSPLEVQPTEQRVNGVERDGIWWWVYYNGRKAGRTGSEASAKHILAQLVATGEVESDL